MDGLVDQKALEETRKKIRNIDVKYLLESRVIEDSLEERKTLFPLVLTTERPDTTVSALLQGRVVILINGTPYTLIVPCLFIDYLQHPDEFYSKAGRFTHRLLRLFSWFLAITLVGFYATMVRFHQNWLPQQFEKDLLETKVLFPFWLELFFLTFLVLLLVEGSL
ncbi:spore germination protein, partial [Neobacillus driksii]